MPPSRRRVGSLSAVQRVEEQVRRLNPPASGRRAGSSSGVQRVEEEMCRLYPRTLKTCIAAARAQAQAVNRDPERAVKQLPRLPAIPETLVL